MPDAVDAIAAQWRRERPELELWPMSVVGRISRLSRLLDKELKEFFAGYGLEFFEFDVLATLRRAGAPYELSAGDLVRTSMVTSGAITNRVDRMEAKDLVRRVPDVNDRRSVRIRLTDRGLALVDDLIGRHIDNEVRLLSALPVAERETLIGTLRTLLESLGDKGD